MRGLIEMHDLARQGLFESDRAEQLRDEMDNPWASLTEPEREKVATLSGNLNKLLETTQNTAAEPMPGDVSLEMRTMLAAREKGDWRTALDILERRRRYVPGAEGMYMRGTIWKRAGEPEAAVYFFEHACRLAPENGNFLSIYLNALNDVSPEEAQLRAGLVLSRHNDFDPSSVIHAAAILGDAAKKSDREDAADKIKHIAIVLRLLQDRIDAGDASALPSVVGMNLTLLAECCKWLKDHPGAHYYYSEAIKRDPENAYLWAARGLADFAVGVRAKADLEEAVRLGAQIVWVYLGLAHYYVEEHQFASAEKACRAGIALPATAEVRCELLDFLAICKAELGYAVADVRLTFEEAIRSDGSNSRARHNLIAFEKAVRNKRLHVGNWESMSETVARAAGQIGVSEVAMTIRHQSLAL